MLELQDISLKLGGKTVIRQVSLQAQPGELCVILGPNGAGKSSLLQLMSGYRQPDSGQVSLAGKPLTGQGPASLARQRAVVEQHPALPAGWRVSELIATGAYQTRAMVSDSIWQQVLVLSDTASLQNRTLDSLSGGEAQRVHLARALLQLLVSSSLERYLLLDEATSALDFAIADAMVARLHHIAGSLGIGIVAVMHDLNLALRHADRVLLLRDGVAVASGKTAEVMDKQQLEAIYGVALAELTSPDAQVRAFVPRTSD
ncbi:ATP-binding cassette domain-containing protein [Aquitalea sp. LB_tupeE]|uniref:ATP-binding cassette domain-containing protein n=1 Tax=Aquitalea sp. LB_tupeE TaxID=2748078 RepID=UPI0015B9F76E|nr:ATP-binding cassette domain-containing protein [Aquitalea sp. LB_tupeE]NWK76612.1 ATP-binding cassette domain-containing protein [Aquitalea sp. LB_tupeE]